MINKMRELTEADREAVHGCFVYLDYLKHGDLKGAVAYRGNVPEDELREDLEGLLWA